MNKNPTLRDILIMKQNNTRNYGTIKKEVQSNMNESYEKNQNLLKNLKSSK